MNLQSSRSHSIFTLVILKKNKNSVCRFNLVDLAGSENQKKAGTTGESSREAGFINKSLLALRNVICSILDNSQSIPYRDSILTQLLIKSLVGTAKILFVCCVSPASSIVSETRLTLNFGLAVKKLKGSEVIKKDAKYNICSLKKKIESLASENEENNKIIAELSKRIIDLEEEKKISQSQTLNLNEGSNINDVSMEEFEIAESSSSRIETKLIETKKELEKKDYELREMKNFANYLKEKFRKLETSFRKELSEIKRVAKKRKIVEKEEPKKRFRLSSNGS